MLNPGFQRLVMLDSAGYSRAELPLDDSVSLIGKNNKGKTSLINALQFLLIIDKRRMNFGAHSLSKSQHFYFPSNSSYILLEVLLPDTGTVVLGAVGKGLSGEYQYFAYKGELNSKDYKMDDGSVVTQPKLIAHLSTHGHMVYRYDDKEFKERIYGGARKIQRDEPDFTVFKLEHAADAKIYQQILTNTLKLDKLTSKLVKEYLLMIFTRDLANSTIDFKQEWEAAFNDVNRDRMQYDAALKNSVVIADMDNNYQQSLTLKGKILCLRPLIDHALEEWSEHYELQVEQVEKRLNSVLQQQEEFTKELTKKTNLKSQLDQKIAGLTKSNQEQSRLEAKFTLISDRSTIEMNAKFARQAYEKQVSICEQLKRKPLEVIERELKKFNVQKDQLTGQLNTLGNNLYLELSKLLSNEELERLNKAFNQNVFQLASDTYTIDIQALKTALMQSPQDKLTALGITISLEHLLPQFEQLTETQIKEQIEQINKEIKDLNELKEASLQAKKADDEKERLESEYQQRGIDLKEYDQWQLLSSESSTRGFEMEQSQNQLNQLNTEIDSSPERLKELNQQEQNTLNKKRNLEVGNKTVSDLRDQRIDSRELFQHLETQKHHSWIEEKALVLESLPNDLTAYHNDCKELESITTLLSRHLKDLHISGLTKYQTAQSRDEEISSIIKFNNCLEDEKRALERMARSSVVNVTSSLKELRNGLDTLEHKMQQFNRLISHRQLSDLRLFKIKTMPEKALVDAIDLLITEAGQSDSEQNFDLFNQKNILDNVDIDQAKQILIDEGNARQGLKVSDLFRLEFSVAKHGQEEESFEEIDSAASNGTVLMAKLVTGLAMLHLIQDKRHQVKAVCYLDEALALDSINQANLIEIAREFGFSLIFASPSPLTTVRYCVPISQSHGKNSIARKSWQIFEQIETEELELELELELEVM